MKSNRFALSTTAALSALTLALAGCSGSTSDSGGGAGDDTASPAATDSAAPGDDTGDDAADDQTDDGSDESPTSDGSGQTLDADADLSKDAPAVSPADAIATAKKKAGDGIVHGIELDWDEDDAAWEYEVSILDGTTDHDVEIDAESGKVVSHEKDSTDDKEKAIDLDDPMTFDEGLELAQKKSSGKLVGWKLEYDDGMKEFQFDFDADGHETEVTVDTETERVTVDDD
jgi:uncharacterized membrane protein YkoI